MIASVTRSPARRRGAFTLLEVLVVVSILVILASVGTISTLRFLDGAKEDKARTDMRNLYNMCKAYNVQSGNWPSSLNDLVVPQDGGRPFLEQGVQALVDPWGNQYQYQMQQSPVSGEEEPLISTVAKSGKQLQWPQH